MILNFLNLFIILSLLAGIVYWLNKKVKKSNFGSLKSSKHIEVIDDGINLALGQKVSIVKAGKEYFVVFFGPNHTYARPLDSDFINEQEKWKEALIGSNHTNSLKELGEMIKNA